MPMQRRMSAHAPRRRRGRCRGGFGMRDGGRVGDGVEEVQPHAFRAGTCFTGGRGRFLPFAFNASSSGKNAGYTSGVRPPESSPSSCRFCGGSVGELGFADGFAAVREDAFDESSRDMPLSCSLNFAVDADAQPFGELLSACKWYSAVSVTTPSRSNRLR